MIHELCGAYAILYPPFDTIWPCPSICYTPEARYIGSPRVMCISPFIAWSTALPLPDPAHDSTNAALAICICSVWGSSRWTAMTTAAGVYVAFGLGILAPRRRSGILGPHDARCCSDGKIGAGSSGAP